MVRQTMQQIDADLGSMTERDSVAPAVGDSALTRVSVWLQNGVIRKLRAAPDSLSKGPNGGEIEIWFTGGDVAVVQTFSDLYAFDSGRIVLWTDESFQPRVDLGSDQVMAEENTLMTMAQRWTSLFGITLP